MTTTASGLQLSDEKRKAFELRQKDTGWGYAWAHILPFVFIYYAWTRRTITPTLWCAGGSFIIAFLVGLVAASNPDMTDNQASKSAQLFATLATPLLVKKGITNARHHAKRKLDGAD